MMDFSSSTTTIHIQPVPELHRCRCGKANYGSRASAERAIRRLQRAGKDRSYEGYLHAYPCKVGRVWHAGHEPYRED